MSFDAKTAFEGMANSGANLQENLQTLARSPLDRKELKPFGIEKAADLVGCTAKHIRDLESRGQLPAPKTVKTGSIDRRVYSLDDINHIRDVTGNRPSRPEGAKAIITAFSNLKGGSAKTTSAVGFAQYAALQGWKVLLVDLDPQASATSVFGYVPDLHIEEEETIFDALISDRDRINNVLRKTYWDGLDIIPAQLGLQNADYVLPIARVNNSEEMGDPALRLRYALDEVKDKYDIIVIDTPPALGMLSINSILAADYLVVPIPPMMYDISSSVQYFRILADLSELQSMRIKRLNILISRHDGSQDANRAVRMITGTYGEYVLSNFMMQTAEIPKSAADMQSIYEIDVPRGSRETYRRAIMLMDAVNEEILMNIRELFDAQVGQVPLALAGGDA